MSPAEISNALRRSRKWHQRSGLVAAPLLALVLVTGVLLGHSGDLDLAGTSMPRPLAQLFYGYEAPATRAFSSDGRWMIQRGSALYLDSSEVAACARGDLQGLVVLAGELLLLCATDVEVRTREGVLVERIGVEHGLPAGITRIGRVAGEAARRLALSTGANDPVTLALDTLELDPVAATAAISWSLAGEPPGALAAQLPAPSLPPEFSLERLLLDLHSGRLFGAVGVWVVDLLALTVALLLVTGAAMWYVRR